MATTALMVQVPRDTAAPRFNGPYQRRISENTAVNTTILTVVADDRDIQVRP